MQNDPLTGSALLDRARKIKLFLMDIDGTLTDGSVCLICLPNNGGTAEMKVFNSQDGLGLTMAHTMGIKTGFIMPRQTGELADAYPNALSEAHRASPVIVSNTSSSPKGTFRTSLGVLLSRCTQLAD